MENYAGAAVQASSPRPATVLACLEAHAQQIERLKGELVELEARLKVVSGGDPRDLNKELTPPPTPTRPEENYVDLLNYQLRALSQQVGRVQGIIARLVL